MDKRHTSPLILIIGPLLLIGVIGSSARVEARAGPIVVQQLNTHTPVPTPTASPLPSLTPTSTASPSPTPTRTPTETLDPVFEITLKYTVQRVMAWEPYVDMIIEQYEYSLDPALVLAVIAAESGGDQSAVSYAGGCGLMQIVPKPWRAGNPCAGPWGNIKTGIMILEGAIAIAEERGYKPALRWGLSLYNCSEQGVLNDGCGSAGGLNYADKIITFWIPLFEDLTEDVSMLSD